MDCGVGCFDLDPESGEWHPVQSGFTESVKNAVPSLLPCWWDATFAIFVAADRSAFDGVELRPLYEDLKHPWTLGEANPRVQS